LNRAYQTRSKGAFNSTQPRFSIGIYGGIGNPESIIYFKIFYDTHHPNLMFIVESMVSFGQIPQMLLIFA